MKWTSGSFKLRGSNRQPHTKSEDRNLSECSKSTKLSSHTEQVHEGGKATQIVQPTNNKKEKRKIENNKESAMI